MSDALRKTEKGALSGRERQRIYRKAIREAGKRLPFKSAREQNCLLDFAADDLADAYRIGAEEAQNEIVTRLMLLAQQEQSPT